MQLLLPDCPLGSVLALPGNSLENAEINAWKQQQSNEMLHCGTSTDNETSSQGLEHFRSDQSLTGIVSLVLKCRAKRNQSSFPQAPSLMSSDRTQISAYCATHAVWIWKQSCFLVQLCWLLHWEDFIWCSCLDCVHNLWAIDHSHPGIIGGVISLAVEMW